LLTHQYFKAYKTKLLFACFRLTAREHLEIFAQLKGIPGFLIEKEVYDLLERVGLTDVRIIANGRCVQADIIVPI